MDNAPPTSSATWRETPNSVASGPGALTTSAFSSGPYSTPSSSAHVTPQPEVNPSLDADVAPPTIPMMQTPQKHSSTSSVSRTVEREVIIYSSSGRSRTSSNCHTLSLTNTPVTSSKHSSITHSSSSISTTTTTTNPDEREKRNKNQKEEEQQRLRQALALAKIRKSSSRGPFGICSCLCSLRFLFLSLFVVCLTVNTATLVSTNATLSSQSVSHLAELNHDYVRRFVSITMRDFVGLAETMVTNIGLYVQSAYARGAFDMAVESFVGGELLPFLMFMEQSVVIGPRKEYAVHIGFGDWKGNIVSAANLANLILCYKNVSADNETYKSTLMRWPYTGSSDPDGSVWVLSPASELVTLIPRPYTVWNFPWFSETMLESTHANDTIQWRETVTAAGTFTMTASRRVYGDCVNGSCSTLLGVANVWFDIAALVPFLQEQFRPAEGVVFLMKRLDGKLFGSNTVYHDSYVDEDPDEPLSVEEPYYGPDSPNAIIRTASTIVLEAIRTGSPYPVERVVDGAGHGKIILGASSLDSAFPGLVIVTAMSYDHIYFPLHFGIGLSLGIAFVMLVITLVISAVLLGCIIAPIQGLISELAKVERMELESVSFHKSLLNEVSLLQASFRFAVRKLAEYRAYLPIHLLQETEDDDHNKGGSSTAAALDSTSTSGDGSNFDLKSTSSATGTTADLASTTSASSTSANSSEFALSVISRNRFGVGLRTMTQFVVLVRLFLPLCFHEGASLQQLNSDQVLDFIGCVFDRLSDLVQNCHGRLLEYRIDSFVIVFMSPHHAVRFSMQVELLIREEVERVALLSCPFVIVVDSGAVITGNVGSSKMRKAVVAGRTMSRLQAFVECLDSRSLACGVYCFSSMAQCLTPEYIRFPTDLYGIMKELVVVFRLVGIVISTHKEWMYELHDSALQSMYSPLAEGIRLLLCDSVSDAEQIFGHFDTYLESSSVATEMAEKFSVSSARVAAKRFLEFCIAVRKAAEEEGEEKVNVRQCISHGMNGSVLG